MTCLHLVHPQAGGMCMGITGPDDQTKLMKTRPNQKPAQPQKTKKHLKKVKRTSSKKMER